MTQSERKSPTPQEAIDILDQATAAVHADRNGHFVLAEAINVLRRFIGANTAKPVEVLTPTEQ